MGKKIIITTFFLLILLTANYQNFLIVNALEPSWQIGEVYTFGYKQIATLCYEDFEDDVTEKDYQELVEVLGFNITADDNESDTLSVTQFEAGIEYFLYYNYNMTDYANSLFPDDFFNWNYAYNYNTNKSALHEVGFLPTIYPFMEPQYSSFNGALYDYLNESQVVDTVFDLMHMRFIDVTLGDLLNNITFVINGQDNLTLAREQLTSNNNKWLFNFDLSNYMSYRVWNGTAIRYNYIPYEYFVMKVEIEYTEGGILEYYKYSIESKLTFQNEYNHIFNEIHLKYGAFETTKESSMNIPFVLLNLFLIPLLLFLAKKKLPKILDNKKDLKGEIK